MRREQAGRFVPITEETLKLKKHFYDDIHSVLRRLNKDIKDIFALENLREMSPGQLHKLFTNMQLEMTCQQAEQIFSSIDFDRSGFISLPEFQADFQRVVRTSIGDLLLEQRNLQKLRALEDKRDNDYNIAIDQFVNGGSKEVQLRTKVEIINAKNSSLQKKLDHQ